MARHSSVKTRGGGSIGDGKPKIVHKKGVFAKPEYFVMPQSVVDDPRWPFKDGEEVEFEIDEQGKRVIIKKKAKGKACD